jgi:multicomponent Na+:H+ antiporter subunit F
MFAATIVAIIVTMGLALTRAMLGPTVFDRVLALNMFGTKTVLLIAVIGFLTKRPDFLDLALLYTLINFIGVVAVLRFSKYGHFSEPDIEPDIEPDLSIEPEVGT